MGADLGHHGFLHDGRLVFALIYRFTDGSTVIANLDGDGNCLEATSTVKPGQRIVTTKPGDWLVCIDGTRRQVASVSVWSQSRRLTEEDMAWWQQRYDETDASRSVRPGPVT